MTVCQAEKLLTKIEKYLVGCLRYAASFVIKQFIKHFDNVVPQAIGGLFTIAMRFIFQEYRIDNNKANSEGKQ
jgi:homoserine kinase